MYFAGRWLSLVACDVWWLLTEFGVSYSCGLLLSPLSSGRVSCGIGSDGSGCWSGSVDAGVYFGGYCSLADVSGPEAVRGVSVLSGVAA